MVFQDSEITRPKTILSIWYHLIYGFENSKLFIGGADDITPKKTVKDLDLGLFYLQSVHFSDQKHNDFHRVICH